MCHTGGCGLAQATFCCSSHRDCWPPLTAQARCSGRNACSAAAHIVAPCDSHPSQACRFLLVFAATALILDLIIPGPIKEGIETQTGHMPKYVWRSGQCERRRAAVVVDVGVHCEMSLFCELRLAGCGPQILSRLHRRELMGCTLGGQVCRERSRPLRAVHRGVCGRIQFWA